MVPSSLSDLTHERETSRVRAGFRGVAPALATLVLLVAASVLLGSLLDAFGFGRSPGRAVALLTVQAVLYFGLIGSAVWLATRCDRRPVAAFGLHIDARWWRALAAGVAINAVAGVGSVWWASARGFRTVDFAAADVRGLGGPLALVVVPVLFVGYLFVQNVYEELVYRGIMLRNFVEGLTARGVSPRVAAILAATVGLALFGLYHLPLRGSFLAVADAALMGIPFALAYLLTGELGLSIGLHAGRLPLALGYGIDIFGVHVLPVVQLTRDTLAANLEYKLVQLALACVLVLVWVYLNDGEIEIDETLLASDTGPSRAD